MTTPLPIRMPFARKNVATAMLARDELCRVRESMCLLAMALESQLVFIAPEKRISYFVW